MSIKLIAGLILAGLLVLFAIQNAEPVQFRFLVWSFALSRALMMFILLAIGVLLGWMMHAVSTYRDGRQRRGHAEYRAGGESATSKH